ncbi:MAG TPA: helix-turn-helix transcriptional regulator [Chthoniobacteraceae bacterium]|nr:helix-turn-helix transcriptional regulator [Chthoniobacteraceae bacterium]
MECLYHGVGRYQVTGPPFGPACWEWHDIIVALRGGLEIVSGEVVFSLEEGDALLIPPGNSFRGRATAQESRMWVFHFRDYRPGFAGSPFGEAKTPVMIREACLHHGDRALAVEFTRRWRERADDTDGRVLSLLGEALLVRMENAWLHPPKKEPSGLKRAVEEAERFTPERGVESMARRAGMSPSYFRLLFREHYGVSPARFLQQGRMERAKRLLRESENPIKEIGQTIGYGEPAAFHRAFRREVGMTPAAYRQRHGRIV